LRDRCAQRGMIPRGDREEDRGVAVRDDHQGLDGTQPGGGSGGCSSSVGSTSMKQGTRFGTDQSRFHAPREEVRDSSGGMTWVHWQTSAR
jgi:hypothetical protein